MYGERRNWEILYYAALRMRKICKRLQNAGTVTWRGQCGNHRESGKYSHIRIDSGYVKMTENERAYNLFFHKINEIFALFRRKTLYSFFLCDIMDEVDGQERSICSARKE